MKYIIWGAGGTGSRAFSYFGRNRVLCFADTHLAGEVRYMKDVISFQDMIKRSKENSEIIIVIASEKHSEEMEQQIKQEGIERYFVFHEEDESYGMRAFLPFYYLYKRPVYESYTQILAHWDLLAYQIIVIYGINHYIAYLITEVMDRNPEAEIRIVAQEGYQGEEMYTWGV